MSTCARYATRRQPLVCMLQCRPLCVSASSPPHREPFPSDAVNTAEPIHILGIGSIGNLVAHSLAKVSPLPPVVLLLHRPQLLSEWERAGRHIDVAVDGTSDKQGGFATEMVSQDNSDASKAGSIIRNLIVTTKTHATSAAIQLLKHRLSNKSTILFLQNGMGTIEEVTSLLFPTPSARPHFLAGITSHGVYKTGPFSIVHAGFGTTIVGDALLPNTSDTNPEVLGPIPSTPGPPCYLLRQLSRAHALGVTAVSPTELFYAQLEKLTVNAMINPLTVIFNCHNGQLFNRPPIARLMLLLLTEAAAVVRQLALRSPGGSGDGEATLESRFSQPVLEDLVRKVATKTGKNISSMLQDARASRKTEVDYINGYIVAQGMELGIDCVHNRTITQMVKDGHVISEAQIPDFFPR